MSELPLDQCRHCGFVGDWTQVATGHSCVDVLKHQLTITAGKLSLAESELKTLKYLFSVSGKNGFFESVVNLTAAQETAVKLYKPPFRYDGGYIFDALGNMFSDSGGDEVAAGIAARIRGWGRLQYVEDEFTPAELQDTVGELVAFSLTKFWEDNAKN